jgi:hypothetical protein
VILSFVIISFFLILRASGYVLNLKAKTIEKTGLIVISSDPKGALLYVNGKYKEKTPCTLNYLRPGLYHLKIEKEGYKDWEKTEQVEAGKYIKEEPVLFLEKPIIEEATNEIENNLDNLNNLEMPKEIPKEAQDLAWDKNKRKLLYRTESEIWLYFLDKPEKERFKIVARFSKPIKKVVFYPTYSHILFVIENELHIIEISGTNDTKLLDLPSLDFWVTTSGKEIIYKENGGYKKATVR